MKEVMTIRIRMIMVLYADDTDKNPYRYVEAELVDYSSSAAEYFSVLSNH